MIVCLGCRQLNPHHVTLVKEGTGKFAWFDTIWTHDGCGGTVKGAPRRWSPPKKNNDRAWKRIANGEWLWDRRRVRRKSSGWYWPIGPKLKPGQYRGARSIDKYNRPKVDLGG